MSYTKFMEVANLLHELDKENGGVVSAYVSGIDHKTDFVMAYVDALMELAGVLEETVTVVERKDFNFVEFSTAERITFRAFHPTEHEIKAIKERNNALVQKRKDEFRKEMRK